MQIYESAEDYLEAILMLKERNGSVHSVDIAQELGYSKASISVAMKKLRENGYIEVDRNNHISLTQAGSEIAERIYERHRILTALLMRMGVTETTAKEDACRLEHNLSDESWQCIKAYAETIEQK